MACGTARAGYDSVLRSTRSIIDLGNWARVIKGGLDLLNPLGTKADSQIAADAWHEQMHEHELKLRLSNCDRTHDQASSNGYSLKETRIQIRRQDSESAGGGDESFDAIIMGFLDATAVLSGKSAHLTNEHLVLW